MLLLKVKLDWELWFTRKLLLLLLLTEVNSADEAELSKLISTINANYIEKYEENRKHWGGGIMGSKANDKIAKRLKLLLLLFLLLTK